MPRCLNLGEPRQSLCGIGDGIDRASLVGISGRREFSLPSFPLLDSYCPSSHALLQQSLWKKGQSSIYELFTTSSHAEIAPYIVYSASFGSEPVGDWVDGDNFIQDLTSFRSKVSTARYYTRIAKTD